VAMGWAQRLKRVFGIEIDTCQRCGGTLRIVASIEQPEVIAMISRTSSARRRSRSSPRFRSGRGRRRGKPACCDLEETAHGAGR